MKSFNKAGIVLAALILTSGLASASPAALNLFPETSSTRIDSFTSYELEVENTGPTKDVYTLSSSSASEITIAPQQVELEPGDSETVNVWYNPETSKDEGRYSFDLTATSRATGDRYSTTGNVEVIKEHQVDLRMADTRTSCLGQQATYTIEVQNTGIQPEEFSISSDFGELSRNRVNLEDGQTAEITLTMSSDTPVERSFEVVAASTTSYAQDIENVQFTAETCYDSEVSVTPENRDVAAQTEAEFDVNLRNLGTRQDSFTVSASSGELEDSELTVDSGTTGSTTLTVTPEQLGEQQVTVTVSGNSEASRTVNLNVYNGMNSEIEFEETRRNICETDETTFTAEVRNTGEADETFNLSTSVGTLEEDQVELDAGESEEVEIEANATEGIGSHTVTLTSTATSYGEPVTSSSSTLQVENCYDLNMEVIPEVISAGENKSAIYKITLNNTGTRENTYELSYEGPEWISIKPEEVTVPAGETGTVYMYAGIPYEKKGEVQITATAEGTDVVRSRTATLLVGEEIEDAIRNDQNNLQNFSDRITGAFTSVASDSGRVAISVVVGLIITASLLYLF